MNKRYTLFLRAGMLALLSGLFTVAHAQLKVGDNPGTINKASVLELESPRQGLLLTRITDTTLAPLPTAPDGMIIYLTTDQSLRVRSNGAWVRLSSVAEAAANWSLKGNGLTDPATNYIGTSDLQGLSLRTNATEAIHINTNQTLQFKSVLDDASLVEALVINPADGTVSKRALSPAAFGDAIRMLNGLTNQGITIKGDTANAAFGLTANAVDGTITFNIPAVGPTSERMGLLTYADWLSFSSKQQAITIGAFATTSSATGLTLANGVLTLTPADGANPGAVSTTAQTFAGPKTFADNLTATNNATVGGALAVTGASTLTGATTVGNTLGVTGATTLGNTLGVTGATTLGSTLDVTGVTTVNNTLHVTGATTLDGALNLTTAPADAATTENTVLIRNATTGAVEKKTLNPAAFDGAIQKIDGQTGPVLTIKTGNAGADVNTDSTTTANTIVINVPDAAATARGVVTTGDQTFAGAKTFRDTIAVGANAVIGGLTSATAPVAPNSTLQVNGSMSLAIRTVTSGTTLTATDNTVLVNGSAAITVTLPTATDIIGRVYTIKKIGGGIDNPLTIAPTGGLIEGAASYIIYNDFTYVTVQTDGTNWYVIRK